MVQTLINVEKIFLVVNTLTMITRLSVHVDGLAQLQVVTVLMLNGRIIGQEKLLCLLLVVAKHPNDQAIILVLLY